MNPIDFSQANARLAPPTHVPGEAGRLPVFIDQSGGITTFISCWQPTPEEQAAIAAGAPIWLFVVGRQPPVAISTEHPFETGAALERPETRASAGEIP